MILPSPLQMIRHALAAMLGVANVSFNAVEFIPRRLRVARRQLGIAAYAVVDMRADVATIRDAIEPVAPALLAVDDNVDTVTQEVGRLRAELTQMSGQMQQLVDSVPDLKPDGPLDRARAGIRMD